MKEKIEKRAKNAKTFKIILFVLLGLCVVFCIAMLIPVFAFGILLLLVLWCIYLSKFSPALGNSKWLQRKGYTNAADEFTVTMPKYNKSKVVCGTKALLLENTCVVLPYAEIAWMYIEVKKLYGLIPTGRSILIFTRDGNSYYAPGGNVDELRAMLTEHILRANPNVLVGFGAEQQKKYKEIKAANK